MKVSKKPRQGRVQAGKETPSEPRTICPLCQKVYLDVFYGRVNGIPRRRGLYCPNDECGYCKKDKKE